MHVYTDIIHDNNVCIYNIIYVHTTDDEGAYYNTIDACRHMNNARI